MWEKYYLMGLREWGNELLHSNCWGRKQNDKNVVGMNENVSETEIVLTESRLL